MLSAVSAADGPCRRSKCGAAYFLVLGPRRKQPQLLLAFLHDMPKGGDLHNHLDGAIYAEDLIDFAASGNFCADRAPRI